MDSGDSIEVFGQRRELPRPQPIAIPQPALLDTSVHHIRVFFSCGVYSTKHMEILVAKAQPEAFEGAAGAF